MTETNQISATTIRTRHFRQRQRAGIRIVQFELLPQEIDTFVRQGLITARQSDDRLNLSKAIERVLEDWMERHRRSI